MKRISRIVKPVVPQDIIESKILFLRQQKVILDFELAFLYDVETKQLKRAVGRNQLRFPADFMFELTKLEYRSLRCQIGTLKRGRHSKYLPYAFTEQGVAMLSSVLNSERAILVNIEIMRSFSRIREMISTHKDLQRKIDEMEKKYDRQFKIVFDALRSLFETPEKPKEPIGFRPIKK